MQITPCDTDFNLDRHIISFLQDNPFFAELSRHIRKCPTLSIPTAAVAYDVKADELTLWWNPYFFGGGEQTVKVVDPNTGTSTDKVVTHKSLSPLEIRGVITHEYYHLVFGHLYGRRRTPPKLWNVATDLAINSIILEATKTVNNTRLPGDRALPEGCLVPGVMPKHPEGRDYTEEEKAAMPLAAIIAGLPTMMASEWYFEKIKEDLEQQGGAGGAGDLDSMDDHTVWDDVPDEVREYVEGKVKAVVEKASKAADSQANGWGNIPADLVEAIRKSVANVINWRNVLRQFIGSIVRGGRSTSIKRINKRYPYIHPGVKRGHEAKLLIAIDQSGSVDNAMLVEFFSELGALTKKVTIDVLPFDTVAFERDLYTWRRGADVPAKRVRGGGTDFNAPTQFANDPKNRGRWDGILCLTDGEASAPIPSRIKRGWVLGKGRKLLFKTDEIQIHMSDAKQVAGAWR